MPLSRDPQSGIGIRGSLSSSQIMDAFRSSRARRSVLDEGSVQNALLIAIIILAIAIVLVVMGALLYRVWQRRIQPHANASSPKPPPDKPCLAYTNPVQLDLEKGETPLRVPRYSSAPLQPIPEDDVVRCFAGTPWSPSRFKSMARLSSILLSD